MNFGNALKVAFSGSQKAGKPKREQFVEIITTNDQYSPPPSHGRALVELYNSNLWVRSIVGKIANRVATQKWYLERPSGERVETHEALKWWNAGTPKLRGRQARKVLAIHIDLAGEAFIVVGKDARGRPTGWAPVPPHWVTNIPKTDDPKDVYEVQPKSGVIFYIPADQVIHVRDPDPMDPYARGSSNAKPVRVDLDSDANAAAYLASFFKNSARPDLIITGAKEAPLSAVDAARMSETWRERFRGVSRAFKPFFSSQPIVVTPVGGNLRDNMMSDVRTSMKATIAEFYGVPPEILGRLESSNRATIDAADLIFSKHVLDPRLSLLLDAIEEPVAAWFGVSGLTLRYETPIEEDRAFQLSVMQARPGAYTDNDFRALSKHKPMEGEEFNKPRPDPAQVANDNPNDPKDPNGDGPKGGKKPAKAAETPENKPVVNDKSLSPDDIVKVSDAHRDPSVVAEATRIMDDIFLKLLEVYGEDLLQTLEAANRFELNTRTANWLAERGSRLISGIDQTTRDALRASLVEGAAANEKVAAIVERIEEIFDAAALNRAPVIAQTEATALTGFAGLEAAKQGGFERKKWLTSGDHVVRTSHAAMNGQTKLVSEKFVSPSGAQADHPGGFGVAAEDINCRCAMRPVLSGEADKAVELSDASYDAKVKRMRGAIATRLEGVVRGVFLAQKKVVLAELNRITGGAVYVQ